MKNDRTKISLQITRREYQLWKEKSRSLGITMTALIRNTMELALGRKNGR